MFLYLTVVLSIVAVCWTEDAISGDSIECDFDNHGIRVLEDFFNGNWNCMTQDTSDVFDWSLGTGRSSLLETGAQNAYSGNYYFYIDASSQKEEDYARFSLPPIKSSGTKCVEFMYHMYGKNTGVLTVYDEGPAGFAKIWEEVGDHENTWLSAAFVADMEEGHKITFQGTVGNGILGNIAVDHIREKTC